MDNVIVTQADRARKKRIQQRFLTDGISHSQVLDEELADHRTEATRQAEADKAELVEALRGTREMLSLCEQIICDECCPTVWRTDDPQPHSKIHYDIRETLFQHEHLVAKHGGNHVTD